MATKIDKVMERIRLLLARADHPNTPVAEAELARERAERLMAQHRIEEASLTAAERAVQGITPQDMTWWVCPNQGQFVSHYYTMAIGIASHVGAEVEWKYQFNDEDGKRWLVGHVFGFESDLRYGALLLNACVQAFGERLEPKHDPNQTDAENVWRMRHAGMERNRIAAILWGASMTDGVAHGKVTRLLKQEAERRGESVHGVTGKRVNAKTYRASYADAFVGEIGSRLWRLRQSSGGSEMVLQSRQDEVKEAFYTAYPNRRPVPAERGLGEGTRRSECTRCAKTKSGYCRDHAYLRPSRARDDRPFNWAAASRGREAAQSVDLGASKGSNRLE